MTTRRLAWSCTLLNSNLSVLQESTATESRATFIVPEILCPAAVSDSERVCGAASVGVWAAISESDPAGCVGTVWERSGAHGRAVFSGRVG